MEANVVTLVTGGTGFVASNIVRELARRGHHVVSLDVVEADDLVRKYIEPWKDRVTWAQGDILDMAALEQVAATHRINKIVHAAVYTGIREDIERADSRRIVEINVAGTANLLELARQVSVEQFLYVSSGAVYGEQGSSQSWNEDVPKYPRTLYAVTKYASELITERYGELHAFETVSVRLGGPYGPMERVTGHRAAMGVMYEWTGRAVRGELIDVVPPSARGIYTYVQDIAAGISTVLDSPTLPHHQYNLSRGVRTTLAQLIAAFREAYPEVNFVEPVPAGPETADPRIAGGLADVSRIREDLGFETQYDPVAGLKEYFKWRKEFNFTG